MEEIYIYGIHPSIEVLKDSPLAVKEIFIRKGSDSLKKITPFITNKKTFIREIATKEFDKRFEKDLESKNTQGVVLMIGLPKILNFDDFLNNIKPTIKTSVILLDELTDAGNVGAIIRSAVCLGASAILMPKHNQAPINGTVYKTSAGLVSKIPLVEVVNVNTALSKLKEKGFWIYGLSEKAENNISDEKFETPVVFVIGNEHNGIRAKTLEVCDILLKIPMENGADSLNASVASAILMYEWKRNLR